MNNDAGWCGSGRPWITPELSMQRLVWTETAVRGPAHFGEKLAAPAAVKDFYRDVAVLAYPTPAGTSRIGNYREKSADSPWTSARRSGFLADGDIGEAIARDRLTDITARDGSGRPPHLGRPGGFPGPSCGSATPRPV